MTPSATQGGHKNWVSRVLNDCDAMSWKACAFSSSLPPNHRSKVPAFTHSSGLASRGLATRRATSSVYLSAQFLQSSTLSILIIFGRNVT